MEKESVTEKRRKDKAGELRRKEEKHAQTVAAKKAKGNKRACNMSDDEVVPKRGKNDVERVSC